MCCADNLNRKLFTYKARILSVAAEGDGDSFVSIYNKHALMFGVNDLCIFATERGSIMYKMISIHERFACLSRSFSVDLLCHGNINLQ